MRRFLEILKGWALVGLAAIGTVLFIFMLVFLVANEAHGQGTPRDSLDNRCVMLLGDSQTVGAFGIHMGYQLNAHGVNRFIRVGETGWGVVNWWNHRFHIKRLLENHEPDLVLVELGGNDWYRVDNIDYAGYVRNLDNYIQDHGPDNVTVVWIGPARAVNASRERQDAREDVADIIKSVVGESRFVESRDITGHYGRTEDGIHFTYDGGRQWAEQVVDRLSEKLRCNQQ